MTAAAPSAAQELKQQGVAGAEGQQQPQWHKEAGCAQAGAARQQRQQPHTVLNGEEVQHGAEAANLQHQQQRLQQLQQQSEQGLQEELQPRQAAVAAGGVHKPCTAATGTTATTAVAGAEAAAVVGGRTGTAHTACTAYTAHSHTHVAEALKWTATHSSSLLADIAFAEGAMQAAAAAQWALNEAQAAAANAAAAAAAAATLAAGTTAWGSYPLTEQGLMNLLAVPAGAAAAVAAAAGSGGLLVVAEPDASSADGTGNAAGCLVDIAAAAPGQAGHSSLLAQCQPGTAEQQWGPGTLLPWPRGPQQLLLHWQGQQQQPPL